MTEKVVKCRICWTSIDCQRLRFLAIESAMSANKIFSFDLTQCYEEKNKSAIGPLPQSAPVACADLKKPPTASQSVSAQSLQR